ncbi:hypothetical protein, partial [uncultured Ruminococcus sp.]|uniref:hypothetical protein n=1 Tax=uncultured Ruminococcus sp. TaxID=165186 RepID=UPI0026723E8F
SIYLLYHIFARLAIVRCCPNSFSAPAEHAFICPALISIPALLSKSTAVDDIIILDFSQLCNTIYAKRSFSS